MKKFKGTSSPWSYSPQDGTLGHCDTAQVWDSKGWNLAIIEPTKDPEEATANAKLIAAAPELLEALSSIAEYQEQFGPMNKGLTRRFEVAKAAIDKALAR